MKPLMQYLAVGAGGSLGAMLRYFVATLCGAHFDAFPVGTLLINVTGSLFLGWFAVTADRLILSETTRLAIAVGFVGGYTTFSTFALESNSLLQDGAWIKALFNTLGSLALGLVAVRVGILLASRYY
jgi:CrcB protein